MKHKQDPRLTARILQPKPEDFVERLRHLRKLSKLTQEQMTGLFRRPDNSFISVETYRQWEQGRSLPMYYDILYHGLPQAVKLVVNHMGSNGVLLEEEEAQ